METEVPLPSASADYRALFEDAYDAVLVVALDDGAILEANARACAMYGYPRRTLLGMRVHDLAEDPRAALRRRLDILREGAARFETRHRAADGRTMTVEVSAARCAFGSNDAIVGVHRDVTDRVTAEHALAESERRLRDMLGNMRMIAVVLDPLGRVQFANTYFLQLMKLSLDDVLGQDWFTRFVPAAERSELRAAFVADLRAGTVALHERSDIVRDGTIRHTIAWNTTVLRDGAGRITGTARIGDDVTERVRAEHALRESEERYALAALGSNDGLWDWDLRTDSIYYSPRWCEMLGYERGHIGDSPDEWFERVHVDDAPTLRQDLDVHLSGQQPLFRSEFRMQQRDGSWRWMLARGMAVRHDGAPPHRMAGSLSDVHDRRTVEQQILHDALHDGLTGLPNRTLFLERVGRSIVRSRRAGRGYAVLFLDLDRFKLVNDSLGHAIGDALLVEVAARLRRAIGPEDTLARPGGDEFLVLLEDVAGTDEAVHCARRLRASLREPIGVLGHDLHVSCSVGVATGDTRHFAAEDVLREADTAAYRAKALGRDGHVLFDPVMHARAMALMQLETGLRRAIEERALSVAYQPIVSLATGRVEGFEALARWNRPGAPPISPAEFIPVAEDTGLIVPLGRFVLDEALLQLRRWRDAHPRLGPLSMSVNVSARQIQMDDVAEVVANALAAAGLQGDALNLEITESVLAEGARVADTLARLRSLRVRTSIDDFGTGYSSLSVLHSLPIDALKIDKRFVDELAAGRERGTIVRTIVDLAHGLGMKVVAEGVETAEQLATLRAMNCSSAQGYLLSRPLSPADADRFLVDA